MQIIMMMALVLSVGPVHAAKKMVVDESALPELSAILSKAGWEMTPEMSGAYQPGDVYDRSNNQRIAQSSECFNEPATDSPYTSMEVTRSLESGVRMSAVVAGARAGLGVTKKIVFDDPLHRQISRLKLVPMKSCSAGIEQQRANGADTSKWFVITEVISAMIQKQECGSYDAKARAFTVSGDIAVQQACIQESLEPVAIAYKTIPVDEIIAHTAVRVAVAPAPMTQPTSTCRWPQVKHFAASMTWVSINDEKLDVRGKVSRNSISQNLKKCGYYEAGEAFDRWRQSRRTTNIAGGTFYGLVVSPFSGLVAKHWRDKLGDEMNKLIKERR